MKDGDTIILADAERPEDTLRAKLESLGHSGGTCTLLITKAPKWFRRREQERGMFAGPDCERIFSLFKDHEGTWTSIQDMKQYTITAANA